MAKIDLTKITLFKDLKADEISLIKDFLVEVKYNQDDLIFSRDKIRDKIIIVDDGLVVLETDLKGPKTIAMFKSGDSLGEMALIEKSSQHLYSVRVVSPEFTGWELSSYNWHTIIKKSPQTAEKIYQNIARNLKNRLTHANNKLVTLFATGKMIGSYDNFDELSHSVMEIIQNIVASDKSLFLTYSPETRKALVHQSLGYKNIKEGQNLDAHKDNVLNLLVKEPGTSIFNQDAWPKGSSDLPYKCNNLIITPIHVKNRVFGFIILGDRTDKNDFSVNNKILLRAIANQLAPAIEDMIWGKFSSAQAEIKEIYIDPFTK
ncbi:MAG: cyclic nucleotide-binding domain-containing protein [Candidatus Komeilibacteria bacterium]|jgi:CRP-like cAMP-binding protein|nr:cyclic nucleotide-binding domain-containing protein [Candidatus Komeilibacteria bacterium]MBT4447603.1 cyclic nucleotide-binding domain-containing protein [Candidatus Komeilibacteria bacterium]